MKQPKKIIILTAAVIVVAVLLLMSWEIQTSNEREISQNGTRISGQSAEDERVGITLAIKGFTENELGLIIEPSQTIFDALQLLGADRPDLKLKYKEYPGMGILVERLGEQINGQNNKYWQYYVNGVQPMISADKYILQAGDKVEWVFQESKF